jgi:hypothetical protein
MRPWAMITGKLAGVDYAGMQIITSNKPAAASNNNSISMSVIIPVLPLVLSPGFIFRGP